MDLCLPTRDVPVVRWLLLRNVLLLKCAISWCSCCRVQL
jgi:hypothetical protein